MVFQSNPSWLRIFYGGAACSWVPHWACHYYRLETDSTFVVGSWAFSSLESVVSLAIYSGLILLNLTAISVNAWRVVAAVLTGVGHIVIGLLHVYRLMNPFKFEVFGYAWTQGASAREAIIVVPFGLLSLWVALTRLKGQERFP